MLTSSSEDATAIYEKFQNIDRHIQFKIDNPDNTGSLTLLDFKMQISPTGKIYTSFYRKPSTKNLFVSFKSAFHTVTNQITLETKLNEFTIDAAKGKSNLHTLHTLQTPTETMIIPHQSHDI